MPLLRRRLPAERLTQRHHRDPQVRVLPHRKQAKVVWRFSDGKPGHDNQSLGLVDALQRRISIKIYDIPVRPGAGLDWMIGRFPAGSLLPDPVSVFLPVRITTVQGKLSAKSRHGIISGR